MSDVFYREYLAACAERDAARTALAALRHQREKYTEEWERLITERAKLRADLAAAKVEAEETQDDANILAKQLDEALLKLDKARADLAAARERERVLVEMLKDTGCWTDEAIAAALTASPDDR